MRGGGRRGGGSKAWFFGSSGRGGAGSGVVERGEVGGGHEGDIENRSQDARGAGVGGEDHEEDDEEEEEVEGGLYAAILECRDLLSVRYCCAVVCCSVLQCVAVS